jgi:hypothetical protein
MAAGTPPRPLTEDDEFFRPARIGAARVGITHVGGEEFKETLGGFLATGGEVRGALGSTSRELRV